MIEQPIATDHYTTIDPARGGWLVQEHRGGRGVREHLCDTHPEAEALSKQWAGEG